ncbi:hypothetical protein BG011_001654 [Mortierella polycephala]|uniref:S-adenosyl-L-methionine-dependent methyltransferase n=1 Tax=Mortierella polycephala TaxID=41804 RepID=A0A9P6Q9B7_9FUNG|nr:hypothetical protein BG011_001654 [Mortierella polycephala]
MSNHPKDLDIYDSAGPPESILATTSGVEDDGASMISVMQDISTFGIAGRIWDSSYVLDVFLRRPTDQYTFTPPCPIPSEYFLPPANKFLPTGAAADQSLPPSFTSASGTESESKLVAAPGAQESEAMTMPTTTKPLRPIRILEIGAGTGYVGIALAKRLTSDCALTLTDLEEVVPLMEKNVQDNMSSPPSTNMETTTAAEMGKAAERRCATVNVEPLAWGNSEHAKRILLSKQDADGDNNTLNNGGDGIVDFVVASDLVYFPELYPPLLQTLREITEVGKTRIIFGYKERSMWKETPFWEEFGRYFEIEVVRIEKKKKTKAAEETKDGERNQDLEKDKDLVADRTRKETTDDEEDNEEEDLIEVFGCEERMYVFVASKRRDEDILKGVDDTLTTLMMMQISI